MGGGRGLGGFYSYFFIVGSDAYICKVNGDSYVRVKPYGGGIVKIRAIVESGPPF
jgi:hypothetical protein